MKSVVIGACVVFAIILTINALEDDTFKCTPGVTYIENKCNKCFCGGYELACTEMACDSHSEAKSRNCEKGSTWHEGCNQCWCTNMGTICTNDCGKVYA